VKIKRKMVGKDRERKGGSERDANIGTRMEKN